MAFWDVFGTCLPIVIVTSVVCIFYTMFFSGKLKTRDEQELESLNRSEQDLDDQVKSQENEWRREKERQDIEFNRNADQIMALIKATIVHEAKQNEIDEQRHKLAIEDLRRQQQLVTFMEESKDAAAKREADREYDAIALRLAKYEADRKMSRSTVKVVENLVLENGNLVNSTKHIQRERIANTDEHANHLMDSIGPELQQAHQTPRYLEPSGSTAIQIEDGKML
ncbi:hypothetical protein HK100_007528 [Physocladia obscura]|uniref:Uncharacterized protein n=1 Tax=Physocladia obscura TaxID=109957 RepID=A0AAD5SRJ7_9FUNG|nr:hypothetical protein HK100_007528 [Physocladia obscura]